MIKKIFALMLCLLLTACYAKKEDSGLKVTGQTKLEYATQFSVEQCDNGCSLIHIAEDDFLLVPENTDVPQHSNKIKVIKQPIEPVYLAASSAMDLFDALGSLDAVEMTSTDIKDWSLPNVQNALNNGSMTYIGKYRAPDFEALAQSGCGLAIESTMIYHTPEVGEQIETLGIPVLVERSSYEAHPLGRMEWIKLYGLLLGKENEAQEYFDQKVQQFKGIKTDTITEPKTVAFFYLTSNGAVNIRKPGDYVSKMIELAGGKYIFTADMLNVDDNALATMNIQLEDFYKAAKDADVLIYSSTIEGELSDIEQLVQKNEIFADFGAVKNGNVWCTEQNMFQQTTGAADMIEDMNAIFTGKADDKDKLTFLHRLK